MGPSDKPLPQDGGTTTIKHGGFGGPNPTGLAIEGRFKRFLLAQSLEIQGAILVQILDLYLNFDKYPPQNHLLKSLPLKVSNQSYLVRWKNILGLLTVFDINIWLPDGRVEAVKLGEAISGPEAENAPSAAFKKKAKLPPCLPEDGVAKPYPGRRAAGSVRAWIEASYPYREGGELLTLAWLEHHDPKAHRALYNQSDAETGPPSKFLRGLPEEREEFLKAHNVELSTDIGREDAKRLYSLLSSRLYP